MVCRCAAELCSRPLYDVFAFCLKGAVPKIRGLLEVIFVLLLLLLLALLLRQESDIDEELLR